MGASVAALTIYDMAKAIDDSMVVTEVRLLEEDEGAGVKAAVLTVSDGVDMGTREDKSGDALEELLASPRVRVSGESFPTSAAIAEAIEELRARTGRATTGGTGVGPRDVTPEATASVPRALSSGHCRGDPRRLDREDSARPARAGWRLGQTLVVNLPGSTGGVRDGFAVLQPALEHALHLLAGEETAHRQT